MPRTYFVKSPTSDPKPLVVEVLVQDPLFAEKRSWLGSAKIKIAGEPWIGAGPISSRLEVTDHDDNGKPWSGPGTAWWDEDDNKWWFEPDAKTAEYRPVAVASKRERFRNGKTYARFAVGAGTPRSNFKFHQANVWAIITNVLNYIETGWIFGRRIPWAFPGGRLRVHPHFKEEDNAYYSRDHGHLVFGYYPHKDTGEPIYTCLSHDTVVHELGHAVLDGLKPLYNEVTSPETSAFHEYFGDALSMSSALRMVGVNLSVTRKSPQSISGSNLISNMADEFGSTYPGSKKPYLRTAANDLKMADVADTTKAHVRSQVLSGAYYDILTRMYDRELVRHKRIHPNYAQSKQCFDALYDAANFTSRMMLRAVDYCPPAGISFLDYARAVLRADEVSYPVDHQGYRDIAATVFVDRGIARSKKDLLPAINIRNDQLRLYNVEQVAASPTDAYIFIDHNRDVLGLERDLRFDIRNIYRTRKYAAAGYYPPREIIVEFTWAEDVKLSGKEFGKFANTTYQLQCGGTLVFDSNSNLLHYALAAATPARKKLLTDLLRRQIQAGLLNDDDHAGARASIEAKVDHGRLHLRQSAAMRHSD